MWEELASILFEYTPWIIISIIVFLCTVIFFLFKWLLRKYDPVGKYNEFSNKLDKRAIDDKKQYDMISDLDNKFDKFNNDIKCEINEVKVKQEQLYHKQEEMDKKIQSMSKMNTAISKERLSWLIQKLQQEYRKYGYVNMYTKQETANIYTLYREQGGNSYLLSEWQAVSNYHTFDPKLGEPPIVNNYNVDE